MENERSGRISVSRWELSKKCESAAAYAVALSEDCRPFVMRELVEKVCEELRAGLELDTLHERMYEFLLSRYKENWFAVAWQKEKAAYYDVALIERFLGFFKTLRATVLETNITVEYETKSGPVLTQGVQMIYSVNGKYYAAIIHYGKTQKSGGGKSKETNILYDLSGMVVKAALEEKYPGISVTFFYLKTEADEGDKLSEFVVSSTKKSQYFSVSYNGYYEGEEFLAEDFKDAIMATMEEPVKKNCLTCRYSSQCSGETIFTELEKESGKKNSDIATKSDVQYTAPQLESIKREGPTLILAGPGSGKTATLVGKIKYLMKEKDVPAPFILMLSFTNDAVREMSERIRVFCEEDEMPNIFTINGLAYNILTEQRAEQNLPRQPILTDTVLKSLILAELSLYQSMDKIDITNREFYGKMGVLQKLANLYKAFKEQGEEEFFAPNRHPECGGAVLQFFHTLDEIIEERGYITFDQQITLCIKLLKENPDILSVYQSIYQYVLVDEFQDVNDEQADLIYMLAKPQNNITVVGDDDQSIYSWRGANKEIMMAFPKKFGITGINLGKNFRSDACIVEASSKVIAMQPGERFKKEVSSAVGGSNEKPVFIQSADNSAVEYVINQCLDEGYSLGDIAILARTNAELGKLKETLKYPCTLAKNYLIKNPFFRFMKNSVEYLITGRGRCLAELLILYGLTDIAVKCAGKPENIIAVLKDTDKCLDIEKPVRDRIKHLNYLLEGIEESYREALLLEKGSFKFFFGVFCAEVGIFEDSAFALGINQLIELYRIETVEDFNRIANELVNYQDESKLGIEGSENSLLLLTMHEAKGLEFPVVIVMDDGKTNYQEDAEGNNLLYVALSRPRKKCYFLSRRILPFFDGIFERVSV